eukprot:CAMPEP_0170575560 /NCGR_PEP_ID=MMETSP0224-20130122/3927_1 /TAXON_ID=285029 /ORGANISM="Togula jolla, Strain CCCM 725" /LENGTH=324 /DNA_ID=CAMNT_0010898349 /DNA_START=161 /DNA_END=1137 /DNA_ORIENTATION=+
MPESLRMKRLLSECDAAARSGPCATGVMSKEKWGSRTSTIERFFPSWTLPGKVESSQASAGPLKKALERLLPAPHDDVALLQAQPSYGVVVPVEESRSSLLMRSSLNLHLPDQRRILGVHGSQSLSSTSTLNCFITQPSSSQHSRLLGDEIYAEELARCLVKAALLMISGTKGATVLGQETYRHQKKTVLPMTLGRRGHKSWGQAPGHAEDVTAIVHLVHGCAAHAGQCTQSGGHALCMCHQDEVPMNAMAFFKVVKKSADQTKPCLRHTLWPLGLPAHFLHLHFNTIKLAIGEDLLHAPRHLANLRLEVPEGLVSENFAQLIV